MSASGDAVWGLQLFENGDGEERLAVISADGYVRVWDTEKRECVKSWDYEGVEAKEGSFKRKRIVPTAITLVKSSPKGKSQLAVAYFDSVVKVFNAETGEEKLKLKSDESYGKPPQPSPLPELQLISFSTQTAPLRPRSTRSLLTLPNHFSLPHTRTSTSVSSTSRLVRWRFSSSYLFLANFRLSIYHRRLHPFYSRPPRRRHFPLLPHLGRLARLRRPRHLASVLESRPRLYARDRIASPQGHGRDLGCCGA